MLSPRSNGCLPVGLWVPSPWRSGWHPREALGAILLATHPCDGRGQPSAARRSGLWSWGCSRGERCVPSPPGFVPTLGAGTFHHRNRSPFPLGTQRRLGLPWLRGPACPSGCHPKGRQHCSLAQATNPGWGDTCTSQLRGGTQTGDSPRPQRPWGTPEPTRPALVTARIVPPGWKKCRQRGRIGGHY